MRTPEKVLWFVCLPLAGSAAGYAYLVRVLRPPPAAVACPLWQLHGPGCTSYEIIASKPFFIVVECAIAAPVMTAMILWALLISHQQANGGYVRLADLFVLAVCLTALLRLLLGAKPVRKRLPGVLTSIGMRRLTGH